MHGFGLQAIGADGATLTQVAARLGVSKQAAAKTVDALIGAGYAERRPAPSDGRARTLVVTARGRDLLARSARILDALVADVDVEAVADELRTLTAGRSPRLDVGSWLR